MSKVGGGAAVQACTLESELLSLNPGYATYLGHIPSPLQVIVPSYVKRGKQLITWIHRAL
jgi:hypothetical protein